MRPSGLYFLIKSSLLDEDYFGEGVAGYEGDSFTPGTLIAEISEFSWPEFTKLPARIEEDASPLWSDLLRLVLCWLLLSDWEKSLLAVCRLLFRLVPLLVLSYRIERG